MSEVSAGMLTVGVKADTRPLEAGLNKGRKNVKGFTKDVDSMLGDGFRSTFNKVGVLFGGLFAAGQVKSFVSNTLESIDVLGKQADKLRISAESLQAYQYAASLADVSAETLTAGIQKMTLNLSAATEESGPALDWLARMGMDARELQKANPAEVFERIGEGLARIPEADRLKAVSDIFGKGNTDLINLFNEGLGKSVDEFERLGMAVSNEDVARIKDFNDSWERLSKSLGALGRGLVIDVSPVAIKIVDDLSEMMGIISPGENKSNQRAPHEVLGIDNPVSQMIWKHGVDLLSQAFMGNKGVDTQSRTSMAQLAMAQSQRDRGINVDGITEAQGETQIKVLSQIRDAVKTPSPSQSVTLMPAGGM